MEEKFDTEFKKKAKCINPDIPDVVRYRISDTLVSLPEAKRFNGWKYLSGIAAILIVSFLGVKFSTDYLNQNKSSQKFSTMAYETAKNTGNPVLEGAKVIDNSAIDGNKEALADEVKAKEAQTNQMVAAVPNGGSNARTTNDSNANAPKAMLKGVITVPTTTAQDTTNNTVVTNNDKEAKDIAPDSNSIMSLTAPQLAEGAFSTNSGIELILKTVTYDGKEIKVEFDRNIILQTSTSVSEGSYTTSSEGSNTGNATSSTETTNLEAEASIVEGYDIKVLANDIPLKCSLYVLEKKISETQYSGTIIIIPDSQLPKDIKLKLIFEKVRGQIGQWMLFTEIK